MLIIDCEQRSDQWFKERLGKPSASNFGRIITPTGKRSEQRVKYMYELADGLISGIVRPKYKSQAMKEGSDREPESRALYELINGVEVAQIGLIYPDEWKMYCCSPDGIVFEQEKGLEMKNVDPDTQIEALISGKMPDKHIPQIQGGMLVTGYNAWDYLSYCPGLSPFIVEIKRNEVFQKKLVEELDAFNTELLNLVEKIKKL